MRAGLSPADGSFFRWARRRRRARAHDYMTCGSPCIIGVGGAPRSWSDSTRVARATVFEVAAKAVGAELLKRAASSRADCPAVCIPVELLAMGLR